MTYNRIYVLINGNDRVCACVRDRKFGKLGSEIIGNKIGRLQAQVGQSR